MPDTDASVQNQTSPKSTFSLLGTALLALGVLSTLLGIVFLVNGAKLIALLILGLGIAGCGFGLRSRFGYAWSAIGGAGLALAGLGFLLYGIGTFEKTPASINWPTAPATIVASHAETYTTTEKVDKDESYIQYDIAVIEYNYSVGDANYASSQISLTPQQRGDAQRLLKKYPIYKQFRAYYNPDNHHDAVLEPGERKGTLFQPLLGLLLIGVGIWTAFKHFQQYLETLS